METSKNRVHYVRNLMVDGFHYVALFVIGATVIWSAIFEYLHIMQKGHAELKDILLLFIYLELGAMVRIYFKTHRLPVQFLIYVAISRPIGCQCNFSSMWRSPPWRGTWSLTCIRCPTLFICAC